MKKIVKNILKTAGVVVGVLSFLILLAYASVVYAIWTIIPKLEPLEEPEDDDNNGFWDDDLD